MVVEPCSSIIHPRFVFASERQEPIGISTVTKTAAEQRYAESLKCDGKIHPVVHTALSLVQPGSREIADDALAHRLEHLRWTSVAADPEFTSGARLRLKYP